jgi:hypothetical protein
MLFLVPTLVEHQGLLGSLFIILTFLRHGQTRLDSHV